MYFFISISFFVISYSVLLQTAMGITYGSGCIPLFHIRGRSFSKLQGGIVPDSRFRLHVSREPDSCLYRYGISVDSD